jgi:hypothetical protein
MIPAGVVLEQFVSRPRLIKIPLLTEIHHFTILTLTSHTHAEEKRVRVRQMWSARRLGQDEQYLTVREILSEASTLADGALSRERSDFYRFWYATLG